MYNPLILEERKAKQHPNPPVTPAKASKTVATRPTDHTNPPRRGPTSHVTYTPTLVKDLN